MNKKTLIFLFLISLMSTHLWASDRFNFSANLDLNLHHYYEDTQKSPGLKTKSQIKLETKLGNNTSLSNEIRTNYLSFYENSKNEGNLNHENFEVFLGENFLNIDLNQVIIKLGYQEVVWGEAFGLHYADIITPIDQRETFNFDYSGSRLPLFLINTKIFFDNGSLQFIYGPEVRFNKSLPLETFLKKEIPNFDIKINKQKTLDFFKENDYGLKVSKTFHSFDLSYFYFNYIDRSPYLKLNGITANQIILNEAYAPVQTHGASVAKTFFDSYVLRADLVYNQDKVINAFNNFNLSHYKTNSTEWILSLDLPQLQDISTTLIYAHSLLNDHQMNSFREKNEEYLILKISKDFQENRILDFAYTREIYNNSHGFQGVFNWGINDQTDIRLGAEHYWGKTGNLVQLKPTSSVFVGMKRYFKL